MAGLIPGGPSATDILITAGAISFAKKVLARDQNEASSDPAHFSNILPHSAKRKISAGRFFKRTNYYLEVIFDKQASDEPFTLIGLLKILGGLLIVISGFVALAPYLPLFATGAILLASPAIFISVISIIITLLAGFYLFGQGFGDVWRAQDVDKDGRHLDARIPERSPFIQKIRNSSWFWLLATLISLILTAAVLYFALPVLLSASFSAGSLLLALSAIAPLIVGGLLLRRTFLNLGLSVRLYREGKKRANGTAKYAYILENDQIKLIPFTRDSYSDVANLLFVRNAQQKLTEKQLTNLNTPNVIRLFEEVQGFEKDGKELLSKLLENKGALLTLVTNYGNTDTGALTAEQKAQAYEEFALELSDNMEKQRSNEITLHFSVRKSLVAPKDPIAQQVTFKYLREEQVGAVEEKESKEPEAAAKISQPARPSLNRREKRAARNARNISKNIRAGKTSAAIKGIGTNFVSGVKKVGEAGLGAGFALAEGVGAAVSATKEQATKTGREVKREFSSFRSSSLPAPLEAFEVRITNGAAYDELMEEDGAHYAPTMNKVNALANQKLLDAKLVTTDMRDEQKARISQAFKRSVFEKLLGCNVAVVKRLRRAGSGQSGESVGTVSDVIFEEFIGDLLSQCVEDFHITEAQQQAAKGLMQTVGNKEQYQITTRTALNPAQLQTINSDAFQEKLDTIARLVKETAARKKEAKSIAGESKAGEAADAAEADIEAELYERLLANPKTLAALNQYGAFTQRPPTTKEVNEDKDAVARYQDALARYRKEQESFPHFEDLVMSYIAPPVVQRLGKAQKTQSTSGDTVFALKTLAFSMQLPEANREIIDAEDFHQKLTILVPLINAQERPTIKVALADCLFGNLEALEIIAAYKETQLYSFYTQLLTFLSEAASDPAVVAQALSFENLRAGGLATTVAGYNTKELETRTNEFIDQHPGTIADEKASTPQEKYTLLGLALRSQLLSSAATQAINQYSPKDQKAFFVLLDDFLRLEGVRDQDVKSTLSKRDALTSLSNFKDVVSEYKMKWIQQKLSAEIDALEERATGLSMEAGALRVEQEDTPLKGDKARPATPLAVQAKSLGAIAKILRDVLSEPAALQALSSYPAATLQAVPGFLKELTKLGLDQPVITKLLTAEVLQALSSYSVDDLQKVSVLLTELISLGIDQSVIAQLIAPKSLATIATFEQQVGYYRKMDPELRAADAKETGITYKYYLSKDKKLAVRPSYDNASSSTETFFFMHPHEQELSQANVGIMNSSTFDSLRKMLTDTGLGVSTSQAQIRKRILASMLGSDTIMQALQALQAKSPEELKLFKKILKKYTQVAAEILEHTEPGNRLGVQKTLSDPTKILGYVSNLTLFEQEIKKYKEAIEKAKPAHKSSAQGSSLASRFSRAQTTKRGSTSSTASATAADNQEFSHSSEEKSRGSSGQAEEAPEIALASTAAKPPQAASGFDYVLIESTAQSVFTKGKSSFAKIALRPDNYQKPTLFTTSTELSKEQLEILNPPKLGNVPKLHKISMHEKIKSLAGIVYQSKSNSEETNTFVFDALMNIEILKIIATLSDKKFNSLTDALPGVIAIAKHIGDAAPQSYKRGDKDLDAVLEHLAAAFTKKAEEKASVAAAPLPSTTPPSPTSKTAPYPPVPASELQPLPKEYSPVTLPTAASGTLEISPNKTPVPKPSNQPPAAS